MLFGNTQHSLHTTPSQSGAMYPGGGQKARVAATLAADDGDDGMEPNDAMLRVAFGRNAPTGLWDSARGHPPGTGNARPCDLKRQTLC